MSKAEYPKQKPLAKGDQTNKKPYPIARIRHIEIDPSRLALFHHHFDFLFNCDRHRFRLDRLHCCRCRGRRGNRCSSLRLSGSNVIFVRQRRDLAKIRQRVLTSRGVPLGVVQKH